MRLYDGRAAPSIRGDEEHADDGRIPGRDDPRARHRWGRLGGPRRLRAPPHLSARPRARRRWTPPSSAPCSCSRPATSATSPARRSATGRSTRASATRCSRAPGGRGSSTSARRPRRTGCSCPTCTTRRTRSAGTPDSRARSIHAWACRRAPSQEIQSIMAEDGVGDMPLGVDVAETSVFLELMKAGIDGPRRPAGDGRRARDQEPRRDHAADAGLRDGRRRLPGHLRGAEAGRPRERHRGARARAAVRDGLGVRRGDQLDRRRAMQPAPARVLGPADPARATRRTSTSSTSSTATGPATTARSSSAGRRRRSATRSSARASGWTRRSTS